MGTCIGRCPCRRGDSGLPENWPESVEARRYDTKNWADDKAFSIKEVLHATPKNEDELLLVCNFAVGAKYIVRAIGIRHNWSPLTTAPNTDKEAKVILVTMKNHFNKFHGVTPQEDGKHGIAHADAGIELYDFLVECEKAGGGTDKIGWGVPHCPAPKEITLGGVLAIDGHGAAFNVGDETENHGSMSNRVMEMRLVAWDKDAEKYVMRDIKRDDKKFGPAVQAHLGRTIVTSVKVRVEPNYYLSCRSYVNIDQSKLFAAPNEDGSNPEKSYAWFLEKTGRAEIIWYPFTKTPWLKVWEVTGAECPEGFKSVDTGYNYTFADDLPKGVSQIFRSLTGSEDQDGFFSAIGELIKGLWDSGDDDVDKDNVEIGMPSCETISASVQLVVAIIKDRWGNPAIGEQLGPLMDAITKLGLKKDKVSKIWGPSKNSLIYVRTTTLEVTANGYAVQMNRKNIQRGMRVFATLYEKMINEYKEKGKFPIAAPLEIRVTGLDHAQHIGPGESPWLSAVRPGPEQNDWDVALWFDVLSIPGAEDSIEFYETMEQALLEEPLFSGKEGLLRPEWSKGWGYDTQTKSAWSKSNFREHTKKSFGDSWPKAVAAFKELDEKAIFSNTWMGDFLV